MYKREIKCEGIVTVGMGGIVHVVWGVLFSEQMYIKWVTIAWRKQSGVENNLNKINAMGSNRTTNMRCKERYSII